MVLLAEWSTSLAALGGAAIGATAAMVGGYFTLRGTTLNVRYQEREAWRARLIEAAMHFHDNYTETLMDLARWVEGERTETRVNHLRESGLAAIGSSTRVALLFGPSSATAKAAERIIDVIGNAGRHVKRFSAEPDEQEAAISAVGDDLTELGTSNDAFLRAVHDDIRPALSK